MLSPGIQVSATEEAVYDDCEDDNDNVVDEHSRDVPGLTLYAQLSRFLIAAAIANGALEAIVEKLVRIDFSVRRCLEYGDDV